MTPSPERAMVIWVDADACPVKDEIERLAFKRGVEVVHVCALAAMRRRDAPGVRVEFVVGGPDAADEWILGKCAAGDLVVTQDVPLAALVIAKGALALDPRGQILDERNIPDRSQMRDLVTALRERGEATRGPSPFTARDRKAFCSSLARALDRLLPRRPPGGPTSP